MLNTVRKIVVDCFSYIAQFLPVHGLAQQNLTPSNDAVEVWDCSVHLSKYKLQMKSSNLQQDKKSAKSKEQDASDEEQPFDDSEECSDEDSSDSQVIDTRILRTPPVI